MARTPESEKKQTSVYLIKRKIKKKMLYAYTYQVRIYVVPGIIPFVSTSRLALEGGVNSNPSSRERIFLRTAYIPFWWRTVSLGTYWYCCGGVLVYTYSSTCTVFFLFLPSRRSVREFRKPLDYRPDYCCRFLVQIMLLEQNIAVKIHKTSNFFWRRDHK